MAIDMHSHWYPESLVEALKARTDLPYVKPGDDGMHTLSYKGTEAPVRPGYTDFGPRMKELDRFGVDTHVVSLGNRMLNAMDSMGAEEATPLTQINNDGVAALCVAYPGRVYGLAMLPFEDMSAAVEEFDRVINQPGIIGATLPGNGFLDTGRARRYVPLLEAAQKRGGAHFLVHQGYEFQDFADLPPRAPDNAGPRQSTLEMQSRLSSIMVTLNMTDFLDPFPDVTIQVHNLGGNLPMEISRMDHIYLFRGTGDALPSSRCRRTMVDCNSLGAGAIELGVSLYGADRIMFGTDGSAFGAEWSIRAIEEARIEDWEKQAILEGTAAALLPGRADTLTAAVGTA
jgi:predicted TIM-barrel fold metal-dependent hydrolase